MTSSIHSFLPSLCGADETILVAVPVTLALISSVPQIGTSDAQEIHVHMILSRETKGQRVENIVLKWGLSSMTY